MGRRSRTTQGPSSCNLQKMTGTRPTQPRDCPVPWLTCALHRRHAYRANAIISSPNVLWLRSSPRRINTPATGRHRDAMDMSVCQHVMGLHAMKHVCQLYRILTVSVADMSSLMSRTV